MLPPSSGSMQSKKSICPRHRLLFTSQYSTSQGTQILFKIAPTTSYLKILETSIFLPVNK